jgi:flagellar protein FlaG
MQDFVQNVKRELQFSVDKDLGRTVVKVVDSESGDLIRQIPEEIFLELARKVKEQGEVNLFNATG